MNSGEEYGNPSDRELHDIEVLSGPKLEGERLTAARISGERVTYRHYKYEKATASPFVS